MGDIREGNLLIMEILRKTKSRTISCLLWLLTLSLVQCCHSYRFKELVVIFVFISQFLLLTEGKLRISKGEGLHKALFGFLLPRRAKIIDGLRSFGIDRDILLLKILPDTGNKRFELFGLVIFMWDWQTDSFNTVLPCTRLQAGDYLGYFRRWPGRLMQMNWVIYKSALFDNC